MIPNEEKESWHYLPVKKLSISNVKRNNIKTSF